MRVHKVTEVGNRAQASEQKGRQRGMPPSLPLPLHHSQNASPSLLCLPPGPVNTRKKAAHLRVVDT